MANQVLSVFFFGRLKTIPISAKPSKAKVLGSGTASVSTGSRIDDLLAHRWPPAS